MADAAGTAGKPKTTPTTGKPPVKRAKAPVADAIDNDKQIVNAAEQNEEAESPSKIASVAAKAKEAVRGEAATLKGQATDKARDAANKGKGKVVETAGSFSAVIGEVATSIDEQFGKEYGDYARNAQSKADEMIGKFEAMDVDEIVESTRAFIRKQPAVSLGVAAAAGFALIRLLKAGTDKPDT